MIHIGPDIRITADDRQVIRQRLRHGRDKDGNPKPPEWVTETWHRTLTQALESLGDNLVRQMLGTLETDTILTLERRVFTYLAANIGGSEI